VAPVLAQVRGDAVRARRLANPRGFDGTWLAKSAPAIPRLANGGDVVNVDSKLEHKRFYRTQFHAKCGAVLQIQFRF
jgi:hypothetical protein